MSYEIEIPEPIEQRMLAWDLAAQLLELAVRRLDDDLSDNPSQKLRAIPAIPKGMQYGFSVIDETQPQFVFDFVFRMVFSQDEMKLVVVDCGYQRRQYQ